ncbi:hypothetical protein F5148DRAFT_1173101 [Russula earlei]|uniref:Uncharacterized protein n=1 Tax=Russula earlei TaxID=71964 RepID=A0ACC0UI25_9AGAM|nr:hypothetical protein F5148DRAFT_1173101 [Russula earlei]
MSRLSVLTFFDLVLHCAASVPVSMVLSLFLRAPETTNYPATRVLNVAQLDTSPQLMQHISGVWPPGTPLYACGV